LVVAVAGAAITASFALRSKDDAGGTKKREPQATAVTAAPATRGALTERARFPGELDADAADVSAFYTGRLVAVHVRVGDTVEKNAVLAELDPVDAREQIAQARAQTKAAEAEERRARVERDAAVVEVKRLEPLARDKLIAELEIDKQRARADSLAVAVEAAAAGGAEARARVTLLERRIVEAKVRAPFGGRIAERYVDPGAIVQAGTRLVRLVQVAPLRVRFEVPEQEVPTILPGMTLRVVTKAQIDGEGSPAPRVMDPLAGAASARATVSGIGSEVSRERRVAIAEALIETPPQGWLPGMYAEAIVDRRTLDQAIIVPAIAVLSRLGPDGQVATGVFVDAGAIARWVQVRVTARDGDRMAIEGDIAVGAPVLVGGHVDLVDGGKVRVAGASEKRPRVTDPRGPASGPEHSEQK
jgi:RND family efflux transporter MFP subunit